MEAQDVLADYMDLGRPAPLAELSETGFAGLPILLTLE